MGHRRGPGLQPPVSALVSVCEGRSAVTSVTLRTAARSGVVRRAPAPVDAIDKGGGLRWDEAPTQLAGEKRHAQHLLVSRSLERLEN